MKEAGEEERRGSTRKKRSHGTGNPTHTSKMLEPTLLETAMSPKPLRATITEVMRSGTDVPAARMVSPMI